jgi:hypothetical protein
MNTIDRVEVDGMDVTAAMVGNTYTFPAVYTDHTIVAYFNKDPDVCVDISDIPMDARFSAAAANIMFVIDDSGSMDWEMMTPEAEGMFQAGGSGTQYRYVFPDAGDNLYSNVLASGKRMYWKSQWKGYNRIFYNPDQTYDPWPKNGSTMAQADPDNPRSHPMRSSRTFNLDQTYTTLSSTMMIRDFQRALMAGVPLRPSLLTMETPVFLRRMGGHGRRGGGGFQEAAAPRPITVIIRGRGVLRMWTTPQIGPRRSARGIGMCSSHGTMVPLWTTVMS